MKKQYPISFYILGITVLVYFLQNLSEVFFGLDYLLYFGAKINELILQGEIWRLVTPVLLHGSLIHLGFNMYALYSIGPGLENRYGVSSFIQLYVISALWGNTLSFLFSRNPSLGASTAIFGLISAQAVYIYKNRFLLGRAAQPLLMNILLVIAINLFLGLSPGIDNWGHLGGLCGGLFYSWFAGPSYGVDSTLRFGQIVIRQPKNTRLTTLIGFCIALLLCLLKFLFSF